MKLFRRYGFIVVILISTLAIIGGMLLLNQVVISLRIMELKSFLREVNREASRVDQLGIVSKFKLHKELYENKINEEVLNKKEMSTNLLISRTEEQKKSVEDEYGFLSRSVLFLMNFFRVFLDKPPLEEVISHPLDDDLTIAYYYERNKDYEEAMRLYDDLLEKNVLTPEQIPNILLHQGFCLSILSDYDQAKEKFFEVIKEYDDENLAVVAALLLKYVEDIEDEVKKIKESDDSALQKSEKLYKLVAYQEAIDILDKVPIEDEASAEKVHYLKARCFEETGENEESVKIYQEIILKDPDSETAKLSNRRILAIASVNNSGDKLIELSEKNNTLINDKEFENLRETAREIDVHTREVKQTLIPTPLPSVKPLSPEPRETLPGERPEETPLPGSTQDYDAFLDRYLARLEELIETRVPGPSPTPALTPAPTPSPFSVRTTPPPVALKTPVPPPRKEIFHDGMGRINRVEYYNWKNELLYYFIYEDYDSKGVPRKISKYDARGNALGLEN